MTNTPSKFALSEYRTLLSGFRAKAYKSASFHNLRPLARDLVIRHDIEISIEKALLVAEIEAEADWSSTYFVQLAREFYNPATRSNRVALEQIVNLGHEIGLHFDTRTYMAEGIALETAAARECEILENILQRAVRITSFHRPTPNLLGLPGPFAGRPHAYEKRFFSEIGYVSDSGGYWGSGNPLEHPAVQAETALQLLMHPYLWASHEYRSRDEVLKTFEAEKAIEIRRELGVNFRGYSVSAAKV